MPNHYNYRFGGWGDPRGRGPGHGGMHPDERHEFDRDRRRDFDRDHRHYFDRDHRHDFGRDRNRFPWWVLPFLDSSRGNKK